MPDVSVIGGVQVDVVITPVAQLPPPGQTTFVEQLAVRVGGAGANAGSTSWQRRAWAAT